MTAIFVFTAISRLNILTLKLFSLTFIINNMLFYLKLFFLVKKYVMFLFIYISILVFDPKKSSYLLFVLKIRFLLKVIISLKKASIGTLFAPEVVFTRKHVFLRKRTKRLCIFCIEQKEK